MWYDWCWINKPSTATIIFPPSVVQSPKPSGTPFSAKGPRCSRRIHYRSRNEEYIHVETKSKLYMAFNFWFANLTSEYINMMNIFFKYLMQFRFITFMFVLFWFFFGGGVLSKRLYHILVQACRVVTISQQESQKKIQLFIFS